MKVVFLCLLLLLPWTAQAQFSAKNPLLLKYSSLNQNDFDESHRDLARHLSLELARNLQLTGERGMVHYEELKDIGNTFAAKRLLKVKDKALDFTLTKLAKANTVDTIVCLKILGAISNARSRKAIIQYLGHQHPYVDHVASVLMVEFGRDSTPGLIAHLESSKSTRVKARLLATLAQIPDDRSIAYIKPFLYDTELDLRYEALAAMAARGLDQIKPEFNKILETETSGRIKRLVVALIRKANLTEFSPRLFTLLQQETDKDLMVILIRTIGDLRYREVAEQIKSFMDEKYHEEVRLAAKDVFKLLKQ